MKQSLDKAKIKILLLRRLHDSAVESFRADGYTNIEYHKASLTGEKLWEAARDAYLIGIRPATHLTAKFFEHAQRLIGVGCFCTRTNQVDLEAAENRGVPVFNAPFSNTRSVAELVLAETVTLMRGIPQRNAAAHRGEWVKTAAGSNEVRGKTLGIVGVRTHRDAGGRAGRGAGDARGFLRHPGQAGAWQRNCRRWTICSKLPTW